MTAATSPGPDRPLGADAFAAEARAGSSSRIEVLDAAVAAIGVALA